MVLKCFCRHRQATLHLTTYLISVVGYVYSGRNISTVPCFLISIISSTFSFVFFNSKLFFRWTIDSYGVISFSKLFFHTTYLIIKKKKKIVLSLCSQSVDLVPYYIMFPETYNFSMVNTLEYVI